MTMVFVTTNDHHRARSGLLTALCKSPIDHGNLLPDATDRGDLSPNTLSGSDRNALEDNLGH